MKDLAKYRRARWDKKIAAVVEAERVEVANARENHATGLSTDTGFLNILLRVYLKGIKEVMEEAFAVERELLKNGSVPEEEKTEKRLREMLYGLLTERIGHILKALEKSNMARGDGGAYVQSQLRHEKEEWSKKIQDEVRILLFDARRGGNDHVPNVSVHTAGDTSVAPPTREAEQKPPASLETLHQEIRAKCIGLYEKRAYAEAVEKGFKVVRDRLRGLTGYETGSEAFGKGRLHIKGVAAQHVDKDFNQAVKFLTMSIDFFRNEKSHTSDAKIEDPVRAYEYLRLSSLAMNLLDGAERSAPIGAVRDGAKATPGTLVPKDQSKTRGGGQSEEEVVGRLIDKYNSERDWSMLRHYLQSGKGLEGSRLPDGRNTSKVDVEKFLSFFEQVAISWESSTLTLERIDQLWGHDIELLLTNRSVSTLVTRMRHDSRKRYFSLLKLGAAILETITDPDRKAALKRSLDMMIELPGKTF